MSTDSNQKESKSTDNCSREATNQIEIGMWMNSIPHWSFIDTHSEWDGRRYDRYFAGHPIVLNPGSFPVFQSGVVGFSRHAFTGQTIGQTVRYVPCSAVNNSAAAWFLRPSQLICYYRLTHVQTYALRSSSLTDWTQHVLYDIRLIKITIFYYCTEYNHWLGFPIVSEPFDSIQGQISFSIRGWLLKNHIVE